MVSCCGIRLVTDTRVATAWTLRGAPASSTAPQPTEPKRRHPLTLPLFCPNPAPATSLTQSCRSPSHRCHHICHCGSCPRLRRRARCHHRDSHRRCCTTSADVPPTTFQAAAHHPKTRLPAESPPCPSRHRHTHGSSDGCAALAPHQGGEKGADDELAGEAAALATGSSAGGRRSGGPTHARGGGEDARQRTQRCGIGAPTWFCEAQTGATTGRDGGPTPLLYERFKQSRVTERWRELRTQSARQEGDGATVG